MVPPSPHCLDWDAYLPLKDPKFGSQDYHLKQPQKTLAYICQSPTMLGQTSQTHVTG